MHVKNWNDRSAGSFSFLSATKCTMLEKEFYGFQTDSGSSLHAELMERKNKLSVLNICLFKQYDSFIFTWIVDEILLGLY